MKNKIRKIISVLLSVMIMVGTFHLLIEQLAIVASAAVAYRVSDFLFRLNDDGTGYILYDFDGSKLTTYSLVEIPATYRGLPVVEIGEGAFEGYRRIEEIFIPDGVKKIGREAFAASSSSRYLQKLHIPGSVEEIGAYAFDRGYSRYWCLCYSGTIEQWCGIEFENRYSNPANDTMTFYMTLGPNQGDYNYVYDFVSRITGQRIYYNRVNEINVPGSVHILKPFVFAGFPANISFVLNVGLAVIASNSFYKCYLRSITIPPTVGTIEGNSFADCSNLTDIFVDEYNSDYKSIDGVLFNRYGDLLVLFPPGRSVSTYEIDEAVECIHYYAFYYNNKLKSIIVPPSVKAFAPNAFNSSVKIYCKENSYIEQYCIDNSRTYGYYVDMFYDAGEGNCALSKKILYVDSPIGSLSTPEREGYTFWGWYSEPDGGTKIKPDDVITSKNDFTVYACWSLTSDIKCGDEMSWELDGSRMTVSGYGNMYSYSDGDVPWTGLCGYITEIEIEKTVLSLSDYSFNSLYRLADIYNNSPLCELPNHFDCSAAPTVTGYSGKSSTFANKYGLEFISLGDCGSCGNGLAWTFNIDSHLLSIFYYFGDGIMEDYHITSGQSTNAPWYQYRSEIRRVEFDDDVSYLGDYALYGCNFSEIQFPKALDSMGSNVVENTPWYAARNGSIVTVANLLYSYKENTDDVVTIGNGINGIVKNFGKSIKVSGVGPKQIQISRSASIVQDGSLAYNPNFEYLYVDSGNKYFRSKNNVLYNKNGSELLCYPAGLDGNISIPDTVTYIHPYAFAGCRNLREITIGRSVTEIGEYAFDQTSLRTIRGYIGSYAHIYAVENGYSFIPFTSDVTLDCSGGTMMAPGNNLFSFDEWISGLATMSSPVSNGGTYSYNLFDESVSVVSPASGSSTDIYTHYASGYSMPVEPNTTYLLTFDVEKNSESGSWQVYVFTDFDVQGDDIVLNGDSRSFDSSLSHRGVFDTSFKFTTGSSARSLRIRFGNRNAYGITSTFSNIKVRKIEKTSLQVLTVETGTKIGDLSIPSREKYNFLGWYYETDEDDILLTQDFVVKQDISIYAHWEKIKETTPYVTDISIKNLPSKTNYYVGDDLDTTGLILNAKYSNGTTREIKTGYYCTPYKLNSSGVQNISISFSGKTTTFEIAVAKVVPTGISIVTAPDITTYYIGDSINTKGLTVDVEFNNGTTKIIRDMSLLDFNYDFESNPGTVPVNVSFTSNGRTVSAMYEINLVNRPRVYSETVSADSGDTVGVPVYIRGNEGLMGYVIELCYDPEVFEPVGVDGGYNTGTFTSDIGYNKEGTVRIIWNDSSEYYGNGRLFTVYFDVLSKAKAQSYSIDISYSENDTFNENYANVALDCIGTTVTVVSEKPIPEIFSEEQETDSGQDFFIPVYIRNNIGFEDLTTLSVIYNSDMFEFLGVDQYDDDKLLRVSDNHSGTLRLVWNEFGSLVPDGVLIRLHFKASKQASGDYIFRIISNDSNWKTNPILVNVNKVVETAIISSPEITAVMSSTIEIPVQIEKNQGIMGFQLDFIFDSDKLIFSEVVLDDRWNGNLEFFCRDDYLKVIWTGNENVEVDGTVFTLSFEPSSAQLSDECEISITYSQDDTFDSEWNSVPLICNNILIKPDEQNILIPKEGSGTKVLNGFIYGIPCGTESVENYLDVKEGYELECEINGKIGTGYTVNVTKDGLLAGVFIVVIIGDVNGDGWCDGMDSVIVKCFEKGMLNEADVEESVYLAADSNHDGEINASDVLMLEQAGLLLANVDQTAPQEELMESDSYVEYLNLIDQNPTADEVTEEPTQPEQKTMTYYIEKNVKIIVKIIEYVYYIFKLAVK